MAAPTAEIPPTTCSIGYQVLSSWSNAFQGEIKITIPNPGTTAVSDWTLVFDFPLDTVNHQVIANLWGGVFAQSGGTVTLTPAPYDSAIPAGGSVTIGFQVTEDGNGYSTPAYFTLDGSTCARV